jgi:predicted GNAT family acetyltransferase
VLKAADVERRISGVVEAPERFVPLLRATFADVAAWDRVMLELQGRPRFSPSQSQLVRRLGPADAYHLWGLSPNVAWIAKTWGGPAGLAASGHAWGAFAEGRLVSVACSFFLGARYEDLGVVTEPEFRSLGLSVACAGALCEEIQARGRTPSWTTSPDNAASLRVAEKLGFSIRRHDRLYVVGMPVPEPARRRAR